MNYWAFGVHESYEYPSAMQSTNQSSWFVGQSRIVAGDRFLLWKYKGNGAHRGVIGFGEVLSNRYHCHNPQDPTETGYAVDIRIFVPPALPLWLKQHTMLSKLSIARASGSAVYHIHFKDWSRIVHYCGGWSEMKPSEMASSSIQAIESYLQPSSLFPHHRLVMRRLHEYARNEAIIHYQSLGYIITRPTFVNVFDFCCRRIGEPEQFIIVRASTDEIDELVFSAESLHLISNHTVNLFLMPKLQLTPFTNVPVGKNKQILNNWKPTPERARASSYIIDI